MSRDHGAIVAPAVTRDEATRRCHALNIKISDGERRLEATQSALSKWREEMGRALVELRGTFSARGDGFVKHVESEVGIAHQTALDYMTAAGYKPRGEYQINPKSGLIDPPAPRSDPPRQSAPPVKVDTSPVVAPMVPAPKPAPVWTDEDREAEQRHHIARIQPPKMETREDRTRRLSLAWNDAAATIQRIRDEAKIHLTDATTSPDDFESVKKTIVSVARAALDELEAAGALDAPEPRRRQLSILDGGKP